MADYRAIAAVGQALVNILTSASSVEFPSATYKLFQSSDFQDQTLIKEGASIYLYRIGVNNNRRNYPPRSGNNGTRYHPSLPVDLFFLITPWSADAEMQVRLLGWVMRTIEDYPLLPPTLLNDLDQGRPVFAPEETVEIVFDPLSILDIAVIWENLKQVRVLPSVTYVARSVLLDSQLEMVTGANVQAREFRMEKDQA